MMTLSEPTLRWSGLANVVGGVLLALFFVLHPGGGDPPTVQAVLTSPYALEHTLSVAAMALLLLGLPALIARSAPRHGRVAWAGFALAFVGTYLLGGVLFFDAYIIPAIAANAPALMDATGQLNSPPTVLAFAVAGTVWGLGYLVLGVVALRAAILPRWASGLMIIGSIVINLPPQPIGFAPLLLIAVGAVMFGVALSGWGLAIWSGATVVPRGAPARAKPSLA
jgi:hypothetical protein